MFGFVLGLLAGSIRDFHLTAFLDFTVALDVLDFILLNQELNPFAHAFCYITAAFYHCREVGFAAFHSDAIILCMVEVFDASAEVRSRAFHDKPSAARPDGTILVFGAGNLPMRSDEWFIADSDD